MRWTRLRRISGQAFSELGKRNFGRPTCFAISASIALGTSKGMILIFDYHQNLKAIIGPGTKAVESGSITSIAISADHTTVAAGHATGSIFTWDISKPANPFLQVLSTDLTRLKSLDTDGHVSGSAIHHIGFLGSRHTALASADERGMAFSHLASRGMGIIARSVKTTRILGRYPELNPDLSRPRKPSSVLAFAPLPLGNYEDPTDSLGLVAMLTPYLLVIVSTTPVPQTQHKAARPKEIAAHSTMCATLAWYPAVKRPNNANDREETTRIKLAYTWSNVLTILEVVEVQAAEIDDKEKRPTLQFSPRKRWKADEGIVAIQWLSQSVLSVITISQQFIMLEDITLQVTDSADLIQKHIYHVDLFSKQLGQLVEKLDEEDTSLHGVVADAFYMSFKSYKGRLFLLGFNDVSMGTPSNWADRLFALMENGNFIGAIGLATSYYNGETDTASVGLPLDDASRHALVGEKLIEMTSASLRYAFGKNQEAGTTRVTKDQMKDLASACFVACRGLDDMDFLFEDVYSWYIDGQVQEIFLQVLDLNISNGIIEDLPPIMVKDLIGHFAKIGHNAHLEEILCRLNPATMDIDEVTSLCRRFHLYDALLYVWSQALGDYVSILKDLLDLRDTSINGTDDQSLREDLTTKILTYLTYVLTGRVYPTGTLMPEEKAVLAKADMYHFLFSGKTPSTAIQEVGDDSNGQSLSNLQRLLSKDSSGLLSVLNEAFEDSFLNGSSEMIADATYLTDERRFGMSLNRQYIVSTLLEVMTPPRYTLEEIVYLDMFIARNLPKFPQFILLSGGILDRVLAELCDYSDAAIAEDCQLSVEYLLSVHQPPDLSSFIPLFSRARFYRVLKAIYKAEKQYISLMKVCFDDHETPEAIFACIADCLRPNSGLNANQIQGVRTVVVENANGLIEAGLLRAASTLNVYAPELHSTILETLEDDKLAQFKYLREVLEPMGRPVSNMVNVDQPLIERYVRLLCEYDPRHVSDYVDKLKTGDLRLDEVLPALEHSGVIDAAVVLLAREGKVRAGIDRLTQHLKTLEAALVGLIGGLESSPDVANSQEAIDNLVESLQKYQRVGVWLCQGQSRSMSASQAMARRNEQKKLMKDELTADESLWLDLIDSVVQVTRNVMEAIEVPADITHEDGSSDKQFRTKLQHSHHGSVLIRLRNVVQETFTALLVSTAVPNAEQKRQKDMSFLRILRAFLNRASLSSPSLSNLRAVLGAIFSAYSYEESLLALANQLLDKDLFVHVEEVSRLRKRGWRPLGQVCEGCGKKVWGPGAGVGIWDAWEHDSQDIRNNEGEDQESASALVPRDNGKGKAVVNTQPDASDPASKSEGSQDGVIIAPRNGRNQDRLSPLVIFSCRHIFHRTCLEEMQTTGAKQKASVINKAAFSCPLCT